MYSENNFNVHTEMDWQQNGIKLHFYCRDNQGKTTTISDFVLNTHRSGELLEGKSISVSWNEGVRLMDQLWNMSVRPSEGRDNSDVMNAKNDHIKDLQKVLDKFLDNNTIK
jgi:hypothetical protein